VIEMKNKGHCNQIGEPKNKELDWLSIMMHDLMIKNVRLFINVNTHYEGSAPLTIEHLRNVYNQTFFDIIYLYNFQDGKFNRIYHYKIK